MISAVFRPASSCFDRTSETLAWLMEKVAQSVKYLFESAVSALRALFLPGSSLPPQFVSPVPAPLAQASILTFYRGNGVDQSGRSFDFILNQNDAWLESAHDYIQWLFPTMQASQYNAHAPRLTSDVAQVFVRDAHLQNQMLRAFDRMLGFYGFQRRNEEIVLAANAREKQQNWLHPANHNLLRITRILSSLRACGFSPVLRDNFYRQLGALAGAHRWLSSAFAHWTNAHFG